MKKLPLPIAGLMLGLAGLGNLLASHWIGFKVICGILALLIGVLLLVQIFKDFSSFKSQMQNPAVAAVFPAFDMAIMILAGYINPVSLFAKIFWYLAIILHIVLMVYFTKTFIFNFKFENVYAGYFIVYVGICVASLTAPAFKKLGLGQGIFYFSFICLIVLMGLVGYRYIKYKNIGEGLRPLFAIFAAPTSLCLAGYVSAFPEGNKAFVTFMAIVSQLIYFFVIIRSIKLFSLPFYPSFSAFTFPFVISAMALKLSNAKYFSSGILGNLVLIESIFAGLMVLRVLLGYINLLRKDK